MLAIAGACVYMYVHFGKSAIELIKDTERFKEWIDGFGVWGIIVFVAIRVLHAKMNLVCEDNYKITY